MELDLSNFGLNTPVTVGLLLWIAGLALIGFCFPKIVLWLCDEISKSLERRRQRIARQEYKIWLGRRD